MNSDWFTVRVKDKNKKCVGDLSPKLFSTIEKY